MSTSGTDELFDSGDESLYSVTTTTAPRVGSLPLVAERLASMSSGELFGWTQNVAMGLDPRRLVSDQFLILSTSGGLRGPDG